MIIPGMVSATFKKESPDYVLSVLKKAGLKGIEWSENWHVPVGMPQVAAALARKTVELGAEVAAYGSYYRLGEQENPAEVFSRSLQNAVAMQAPLIRIWGGRKGSKVLTPSEREPLAREAALISRMAAQEGLKVALEWHKETVTDTNESAMTFLDAAAAPNLYCLWQPTVALSMQQRVEGIEQLEARGRLLNLHVYHWQDGRRRPFSEGIEEWQTNLAHVRPEETRYGLLEFVMNDSQEQFLKDAVQWKHLLAQ